MSEHIDVDVSGLLRREITLAQAADRLMDMVVRNQQVYAGKEKGFRQKTELTIRGVGPPGLPFLLRLPDINLCIFVSTYAKLVDG
ncbi:hypothetical protein CVV65_06340 [Kyrpidia spormannii]|uniref:Uncharacterized protein n=1 Tax=Kyrpidia spormannii TaxID=2055160 RepID=A0A2K8N5H8_9BACL|nr:hypothetical protein [Kyrpidia spormannii]ATY84611.1 hypothetical protein CVV65_06340 [Kyrpidia spormannii]